MKFGLSSLSNYLPGLKSLRSPENALKESMAKDSGKRLAFQLKRRRQFFGKMQQDELKMAIEMAKDPERPRRDLLYGFYEMAMEDGHVYSQQRTLVVKAIGSPFAIYDQGGEEIDEKATRLMQKPWFRKYRKIYHETPQWGTSLVEFQKMRKGQEIPLEWIDKNDIVLIPREHVRPETGELVLDVSHERGLKYREPPFNKNLIEMGDPYDIGLLRIACKEVIWKNYSRSDWSRHSEKFGMPLLAIKSATTDKKELDKIEEMAEAFGNNLWVLLDDEDSFEIKESSKSDAYKIYKEKVLMCNEEISKLMVGQTGTTDEKAFVGSAEVHERILNEYIEERMREEIEHMNFVLFPFLIEHGYPLEGKEFRYTDFIPGKQNESNFTSIKEKFDAYGVGVRAGALSPQEDDESAFREELGVPPASQNVTEAWKKDKGVRRPITLAQITGEGEGNPPPPMKGNQSPPPKNNPPAPRGNAGGDPVASIAGYDELCCGHGPTAEHDEELERMLLVAARRMYDGEIPDGQLDPDLYFAIANRISEDFDRSYDLKGITADMTDNALVSRVRSNLFSFSGAKSFQEMNLLRDAIFDKDGKIVPWTKYREFALSVNKKYNDLYLAVERNHVIRSGTMAKKYMDAQRDSDRFPYMKYVTVGDDRVRPEHAILHGIIRPVNDAFWSQYWPPNAYNDRCSVESISEREIDSGEETITDLDVAQKLGGEGVKHKLFRNNPGTSGIVYDTNEHPYFEAVPGGKQKQLSATANYGMRPLDQIYKKADKLPSRIGGIKNNADFDKAWKQLETEHPAKGNGFALQSPQVKSVLHFDRKLKNKLSNGNRTALLSEVKDLVNNPDEIWSAVLPSKNYGVDQFQVFIKYYNDKPVALLTEINKAKRLRVKSIHNIDAVSRDSQLRRGVLMYRKTEGK